IDVTRNQTLKAIVYKSGYLPSSVSQADYAFKLDAPTFSPLPGVYSDSQSIAITSVDGAQIRYTINGATPTQTTGTQINSGESTSELNSYSILKAITYKTGWSSSDVVEGIYDISIPTLTINIDSPNNSQQFMENQEVSFTSTVDNNYGIYSCSWDSNRDGSLGTDCNFNISSLSVGTHLISLSVTDDLETISTTINLTIKTSLIPSIDSPSSDSTFVENDSINFIGSATNTFGSYTCSWDSNIDGSLGAGCDINISSLSVGTHLITLSVTDNLETVTSTINIFIILPSCSLPTSTLAAGTYNSVQNVPLTTTTSGADIRYTINGAAPTSTTGTVYSGPISLSSTGIYTIRAKAFKTGYPESDLFERTYIINLPEYIYAWGKNNFGQLGDGTTTYRKSPVIISSLSNVSHLSLGDSHSCALLNDGTVKCWGFNDYGQLGDGTTTTRKSPVTISSLSNVSQLFLGTFHSCVLINDGTVKCWGNNDYGQLGDGTTTTRKSPVTISSLSNVSSLSLGTYHSCALLNDGTVKCWGFNYYGQLGNGTTTNRKSPVIISSLSNVSHLSLGGHHSCVLINDGTVKCWGDNHYGQLGDGTITDRTSPVIISSLSNVSQLSLGGYHSFAISSN
ncbi:MAG: chitobiase/beta-hexosaminidase C-terminal domain-containing protein, partial [Candidatus ainarchaeum sp.]|nr:chitobiase/beta-hexosaminidase C-terminal domain-containing protein [Candidatus ainarchaeum sp.]